MNSGKVRIYELSRELNLDNKDILAVCEQLNISVKSHSSTISDSEAERIRSAAEKYAASSSMKPIPNRQGSNTSAQEGKSRSSVPVQKKQQIVAIKSVTRQPSLEPPTPPNYTGQSSSTVQPQAPAKAIPLSKPAPAVDAEEAEIAEDEVQLPELPAASETPCNVEDTAPTASVVDMKPEQPSSAPSLNPPPQASPELVSPPQRADSPPPVVTKSNLSNRPILKREKAEQLAASASANASKPESSTPRPSKPSIRSVPAPTKPSQGKQPVGKGAEKPVRPQQQTIVELRRPKPVRSDVEDGASSKLPNLAGGEEGGLKLRPKREADSSIPAVLPGDDLQQLQPRPTLPRTSKKAKDWEEEEEGKEFAGKASKVGTKTKRRAQPDLDEDEDLELLLAEEDEEEETADQVSLSLVRPAKPKSMRQPAAKPVAATAPKARKSAPRDRRDRRDQETKVEKPDKITLKGSLTVQELAAIMVVPETDIIRTLFMKGIMATVTQTLDIETAKMVAEDLGVAVETGEQESKARKITEMLDAADLENLHRRPPVVTIMGHVDHGKTSLLDAIRKTKVAQGEAGGITQHIGAYHVDVEHDGEMQQVVFLDTPGHEAFTAMRARGARVTDIAILVVAADDGVQPQTVEAISHAKAAEVPIVVAINKIDKEGAQPDRVKQELTEYQLVPEEWGGETIMVPVSALTGENLDTLLEMILLVAEVEDLYANPDRPAKGTVIEAHLDKAKGPVATLLVQNGTLRVGDVLVAGSVFGKVRAMVDDRGQRVKEASPSFAVEVLGLTDVPAAGDEFDVFLDEKEARSTASNRTDEQRQSRLLAAMSSRRVSLNTLSARAQEGELKELNLVLKADVQGSVEAILGAFKQLPQNEVQVRVLYAAPGEITETDVDLAAASSAVIIGFNTTLAPGARQAADRLGVDVRDYNIIYKLLDDIQAAMEGLLEPELVEEALGQAEVRAVFPVGRGQVAGCYVQSGKVIRNCKIRIHRGSNVIHEDNLDSLKRMKEDVREVNAGYECGIGVDSFNSWEIGDIIEAYRMISKRRTLSK
ncbi:bacterial translation initiation factor 2 (bIF-2) [Leptolyngbyaceae cyanobacterium JSC-12]|nr:bacterial translation initiation factor 2 (bIF-2) [Leptolyngbyaceae cyanobacterium JSC-12]